MSKKEFERKTKSENPVLAICYDFDKTLSPDDMQAQGYIQSVGYDIADFWKESNELAEENDMDQNLAYMYKMVEESEGQFVFNRSKLAEYGAKVALFPGVRDWFERIREYGLNQGVIIEHYIISSGLKEMIEGTEMAKNGAFEKIYASSFYYNSKGVAKWPAQVVNYTNKTQFLFRIEKGVLDINDPGVNEYFKPEDIRVPFRNIIYIGDSDTDVPCMKLVNSNGGHSIGVYNAQTKDKTKVYKMMRDDRIKYFAPADYSENSDLDILVKKIIDRTAANEALEKTFYDCKRENIKADKQSNEEDKKKSDLIMALENS
ncbi:MAG: HAD family hydrolase, partial [Acutalibacteraceae bacterium]